MTAKDFKTLAVVAIAGLIALAAITALLVYFFDLAILDAASSVQAIGIVLAVWVGGLFTLYKLNVFRDFKSKLNIELEIQDRRFSNGELHISVVANIRNTSRVHVKPDLVEFCLNHVVPATFADPSPGKYDWSEKNIVIEPGESHVEVYAFCVNSDVRTVKIHVIVTSGSKESLKWDTIKFYDITTIPEGE